MVQAADRTQTVFISILSQSSTSRSISSVVPLPASSFFDDLQHPAKPFSAGSALAARFMMIKIDQVFDQLDHVDRFIKHNDTTGTEHGFMLGHRFVIKGYRLGFFDGQHRC